MDNVSRMVLHSSYRGIQRGARRSVGWMGPAVSSGTAVCEGGRRWSRGVGDIYEGEFWQ